MHLEDAALFIPYGCMVDEFQHRIYDNPELTPDERKAVWKELEQKNKMDEDYKEAWQSYLKLCRLSASDYFENLLKAAGIRSPFEEGCMKEIVDKLKKKIN